MKYSMILMLSTALLASSKLVVDYTGGQDASVLGNVELEGLDLGCKIINGQAGNAAFIKPEDDSSNGKPSLHLKRDPRFRRAEVKALANSDNKVKSGKTYYIGYNFRLSALQNGMAVFQWKKWDKTAEPLQNIPLYVHVNEDNKLTMEYTIPGFDGSHRVIVWTGPIAAGTGTSNKLGFIINTGANGSGWVELYVNGVQQKFNSVGGGGTRMSNVDLFTGDTSPKFGIYRGELPLDLSAANMAKFCPDSGIYTGEAAPSGSDRIFNSWIYRVQISDTSKAEAAEAAGW